MLNLAVNVEEVFAGELSQLCKVGLELLKLGGLTMQQNTDVRIRVCKEVREESVAEGCGVLCVFANVKAALENKQVRNRKEDLSITTVDLLFELFVLLSSAFDQLAKANQLVPVLLRHYMCLAQAPVPFESSNSLDKLRVVPELRVDYLHVLCVSFN